MDEAGRGAWAGPVAAGAVILPDCADEISLVLHGVRDSKLMTVKQRFYWADVIRQKAAAWGVGLASQQEIDELGILPATRLAMKRAISNMALEPDHILLDAVLIRDLDINQTALIKGDMISLTIAAASVLAKTARDLIMIEMEEVYPGYGFTRHKGYGTLFHHRALIEKGVCEIHRRSFRPVKELLVF